MAVQKAGPIESHPSWLGVLDGSEDPRSGLTAEALGVVEALLAGPIAWETPARLASLTGLDLAAIFCCLEALEVAGLFCSFEDEAGTLSVTLTPLGASRFGVRLVEVGPAELPRWANPETPDPPLPKAKGPFQNHEALACVVGPALSPEAIAEAAEAAELGSRAPGGRNSAIPGRVLGAYVAWSGFARVPRSGPCPVCSSLVIPGTYCLYCDGLDAEPTADNKSSQRTRARAAKRFARSSAFAAARRRAS